MRRLTVMDVCPVDAKAAVNTLRSTTTSQAVVINGQIFNSVNCSSQSQDFVKSADGVSLGL